MDKLIDIQKRKREGSKKHIKQFRKEYSEISALLKDLRRVNNAEFPTPDPEDNAEVPEEPSVVPPSDTDTTEKRRTLSTNRADPAPQDGIRENPEGGEGYGAIMVALIIVALAVVGISALRVLRTTKSGVPPK